MKIGLVVPGGVDASGRIRVIPVLLALIERLARRHELVILNLDPRAEPSAYELLGARVISLGAAEWDNSLLRHGVLLRRLITALRKESRPFDLLHAIWIHPPGTLALAAGAFLRVPVIISIGGGELVSLPQIGYGGKSTFRGRAIAALSLRFAGAISGGSRYVLRPALQSRPNAVWLPLGVETRIFHAPLQRAPGPPWRLLHVAGLNQVKDQTTLLQALRVLSEAGLKVHLDCVGVDTLGGRIQDLAKQLGVQRAVTFHGFLPVDEIVSFYRRAHVYVQSSLHESMGAAVLEAATAGVPTVGTNVGLVADMAEFASQAALAVPVSNPTALANGISELINNDRRREAMAQAAQDFAHAYNADWTCTQFEAMYEKVIRH